MVDEHGGRAPSMRVLRMNETKRAIVKAAAHLFQTQGYAGTGLSEILAVAQAPKGSLYHHFPAGKEAIGVAAIEASSAARARALEHLNQETATAGDLVRACAAALGETLAHSGFTRGCAITTTILEAAPSIEAIRAAGAAGYERLVAIFADRFGAEGLAKDEALALAAFVLASLTGALVIARAQQSTRAMRAAGEAAARHVDAVIHAAPAHHGAP